MSITAERKSALITDYAVNQGDTGSPDAFVGRSGFRIFVFENGFQRALYDRITDDNEIPRLHESHRRGVVGGMQNSSEN